MKITMLGTGHAGVTECYNTCFVLEDHGEKMLVDAGGGNGLLRQLKRAEIELTDLQDIFVTHKHVDHITGMLWILRRTYQGSRRNPAYPRIRIYSHAEVIRILKENFRMLLLQEGEEPEDFMDYIAVTDGEVKTILQDRFTFFDIGSDRTCQYGFRAEDEHGTSLVCLGDESLHDKGVPYAENCTWLMHEAFCAEEDRESYRPHRMNHSTVRDACENAARVHAKNLILYHTEDKRIHERKALYTREANTYFEGFTVVPEDLEEILL